MDQGFKAHGSCWWSQPPIEAVLALARAHDLVPAQVVGIRVETFKKATHLAHPAPTTTEQAQYSVPFPVAAALVKGSRREDGWYGLGPAELLERGLDDPETRRLAGLVELVEAPDLTAVFPDRFLARVTLTLADGRRLTSPSTTFRGELDDPLSDQELTTKFRWLAGTVLPDERVETIERASWNIEEASSIAPLLSALSAPVEPRR
jgi:2-methylcitrate dehydratase PrpD